MKPKKTILGLKVGQWFIMTLLGLSGFIAWDVENTWFNTFVYDEVTTHPSPIAWMVGLSAVTATFTTLFMGTLSDRIGKRKPFIFAGYILWALSTMAYPMSSLAKTTGAAILLVIILDAVMTFFGSTANDAAFNAWVTDITDEHNRGRVDGFLNMLPVIAAVIGMLLSGFIIDRWGYFPFFLSLGGFVLVMGVIGSAFLKEAPHLKPVKSTGNYWKGLVAAFKPSFIRENKALYLVFLILAIGGIANQITYPYQVIYLNNYIGLSKTVTGMLVAVVGPVLILFALPVGYFTDKGKGFQVIIIGIILTTIGTVGFSLVKTLPLLIFFGALKSLVFLMYIVYSAWARNLMPQEARGQFQGVRMVFYVLLPMVLGPPLGSLLMRLFGQTTLIDGVQQYVPIPLMYQVGAAVGLLGLIPVFILKKYHSHEVLKGEEN